jgi:tRNA modification GTPase
LGLGKGSTLALAMSTICALATAAGQSSVGVIRLSGPQSVSILDALFTGRSLASAAGYTLHHGTITDGDTVLDEVVVAYFKSPRSYTGEDVVEITCHGSPYILQQVLVLLAQHGARYAQPGEFTRRAFLNGKLDLAQAEAVADLVEARGAYAHQAAFRQLRGHYSTAINAFRQQLIDFASLVELELDFSEEDVQFAQRPQLEALITAMLAHIDALVAGYKAGNVVKNGIATVIAGAPNAGKSTLLNRLLGEDRAIVSPIPGTTRDTIEDTISLGGWLVRFIDTAGLRASTDTIEQLGIARSRARIAEADLILYVIDAATATPATLSAELAAIAIPDSATPLLVVLNKTDAADAAAVAALAAACPAPHIAISAQAGIGMQALQAAILLQVEALAGTIPDALVTSARHYHCLRAARESLVSVHEGIHASVSSDFLAQDIRQALYHLGEITGQITSDDLLGNIFGRFCIGK